MKKVNPLWFVLAIQIGLMIYAFYRITLTKLHIRWFEVAWVIVGPVILFTFFGLFTIYNIKTAYKEPSHIRSSDRCPVCGTFVSKHQDTATEIYIDGKYLYFDNPTDMVKFIKDMDFYISYGHLNIKDKTIKSIHIKDFKTKRWIDGTKAYYVKLKDEIYPFSSYEDAKDFVLLNNTEEIKTFKEL